MKVFSSRVIPENGVKLMQKAGLEVDQYAKRVQLNQEKLIEICQKYDAFLSAGPNELNEAFFKACPNIKAISLLSVGFDNVDIAAANKYKMAIGHTPDVVSAATADIAFFLMLAVSRKAFYMSNQIIDGKWDFIEPTANLGIEIYGKTLGIFGLGRIGMDLAKKCRAAYNMSIIYHNRNRNKMAEQELDAQYVSFEELLHQSDVLSVNANLSDKTKNIFDKISFQKMKPTSIFINTARGGLHKEQDLIDALQTGSIWGAGLDATNPEPIRKDSPLLSMPTVCVLPHIGTATIETRAAMADRAAQNIIAGLQGKRMPFVANPEIYE
ncbi:2-hydroxyacid dehydrogenase [Arachidicoccus sp.]|uniref:2-hydroxyacid dehydrogenase n=1 Tax=Arachidicoccus sp. TaxID=1872624 RepID=UPI003D197424